MPKLGRNLVSEHQLELVTGQLFSMSPWRAHVSTGEDACCVFNLNEASGLYEMKAKRSALRAERKKLTSIPTQRDILEAHHLMAHPSEHITRMTAKAVGIKLTGEWSPCSERDRTKIRRHTVPKKAKPHD